MFCKIYAINLRILFYNYIPQSGSILPAQNNYSHTTLINTKIINYFFANKIRFQKSETK